MFYLQKVGLYISNKIWKYRIYFRYFPFGIGIGTGSKPRIRYRYQKSTASSIEYRNTENAFGTDSSAFLEL